MDTSLIFSFTALIILSLIYPTVYFVNLNNTKNGIKKFLIDRGATHVFIDHEVPDYDRDTMSFFVRYIGINGNKKTARCKVQRWGPVADNDIYWADPLDLELAHIDTKKEIQRSEYFEISEKIQSKSNLQLPTFEISTVLSLNDSKDIIVMMKYMASFNNVFRCRPDGSIVWQAELPNKSNDVYTNIEWRENRLTAFSRSCIAVILDVETGKILPSNVM